MSFENFQAVVRAKGISRPNRFNVIITPPKLLPNAIVTTKELSLYVESTVIPGKTIKTTNVQQGGPSFLIPTGEQYGEWPCSIRIANDFGERNFFDEWHNIVIDENTRRLYFYNQYISDIQVSQLDIDDSTVETFILQECWPIEVGALTVDHSANDRYHVQPVTFAYKKWKKLTNE